MAAATRDLNFYKKSGIVGHSNPHRPTNTPLLIKFKFAAADMLNLVFLAISLFTSLFHITVASDMVKTQIQHVGRRNLEFYQKWGIIVGYSRPIFA